MKNLYEKFKKQIAYWQKNGVPILFWRDEQKKAPSVSLTMMLVSFILCILSLINKAAKVVEGVDVENSNNSKKDSVEARELFFRYGFECGYEGATLSRFAKCSRSAAICSVKRHKRVCKTSKPKQEYYNRFLKLMENAKKEKSRIQV